MPLDLLLGFAATDLPAYLSGTLHIVSAVGKLSSNLWEQLGILNSIQKRLHLFSECFVTHKVSAHRLMVPDLFCDQGLYHEGHS